MLWKKVELVALPEAGVVGDTDDRDDLPGEGVGKTDSRRACTCSHDELLNSARQDALPESGDHEVDVAGR